MNPALRAVFHDRRGIEAVVARDRRSRRRAKYRPTAIPPAL